MKDVKFEKEKLCSACQAGKQVANTHSTKAYMSTTRVLDTTRRGTLSKNQKYCLSLAKIKGKGQPRGLGRFSDLPETCAEASDKRPKLSTPPRPSRRGPALQGLGRDTNSPIRPRLGSATTSSPPSRPTPLTKRHVQLMRPTTPATSALRWHSTGRMIDGTRDRAQQGLPTTVLITVPPADTRTALCYLTPTPRTKWHGGSSLGPCSLGISMKDQLIASASSETPQQGLRRTIPSLPRSRLGSSRILVASASIVPLASRPICLKCTWSHLLRQP